MLEAIFLFTEQVNTQDKTTTRKEKKKKKNVEALKTLGGNWEHFEKLTSGPRELGWDLDVYFHPKHFDVSDIHKLLFVTKSKQNMHDNY